MSTSNMSEFIRLRFPGPLNAWWNYRRKRFWLLVLIIAYTLSGFFLVPWIARTQLAAYMDENYGLQLSVAQWRVNPFTLTTEINNLGIAESGQDPVAGFERLFVNFQLSSLFNWAYTFKQIDLDGLFSHIIRDENGDFNLVTLFVSNRTAPQENTQDSSSETGSDEPVRWLIQSLTVNDAVADYREEKNDSAFVTRIGPIDLSLAELTTIPELSGVHTVAIETANGIQLGWSGTMDLDPMDSRGHLSGNGPFLPLLHEYLQDQLLFQLNEGDLTLEFDYVLTTTDEGIAVTVSNGSAVLNNLHMSQENPQQQSIDNLILPELQINGISMEWPQQTVALDSIIISSPQLEIWRDGNSQINLSQLMAPPSGNAQGSGAAGGARQQNTAETRPWDFSLAEFRIQAMELGVTDYALDETPRIQVNGLGLSVTDVSSQPQSVFPVSLEFILESGGDFGLDGELTILPQLDFAADFQLQALDLPVVQPWLTSLSTLSVESGRLDINGNLSVSSDQPLNFQGDVHVPEFELSVNNHEERLLAWQQFNIDQLRVDLSSNQIEISQLDMSEPYVRFAIAEDLSTNFQGLFDSAASGSEDMNSGEVDLQETDQPGASEPSITVGQINIENASADFSDLSLPLPFRANIQNLNGDISTLSSASSEPARVALDGSVGEFGLVEISGEVRPLSPTSLTDINLLFRNIDMPNLSSYTIKFAGREIDSGSLDVDLQYHIVDEQLDAQNSVVIDELMLGERVEHPDAVDLPLGLAVALLTGPDGRINLDLPVTGSLDDPEFSIGGVVFRAFTTLITRIVASPFNLLGNLIGAGEETFDQLEFRPGEARLLPPEREKLQKLVEALNLRPNLTLEIAGVVDPVADAEVMKVNRVQEEIESRLGSAESAGSEAMLSERRRSVIEQLAMERLSVDLVQLQNEHRLVTPQQPDAGTPDQPPADFLTAVAGELDVAAYLAALESLLAEAETVTESDLALLSVSRASALEDELVTELQLDPSRIVTIEPVETEVNDDNWVILELALGNL